MLKKTTPQQARLWMITLLALAITTPLLDSPARAQESSSTPPPAFQLIAGEYEIYLQGQYYVLIFEETETGVKMLSPVLGNRDLQVDDLDHLLFSFTDQDGVNSLEFILTGNGTVDSFFLSWGQDDRHEGRRIDKDRVFRDAFTRQEMLEDLTLLEELMQIHPRLNAYTSAEEFGSLRAQARSQMHDDMTAAEFYRAAAPLVAAIGCYHTRASAPSHHWDSLGEGLLPLGLEIVNDQVLVREDYSAQKSIAQGSELLTIEGRPVGEIVEKLGQYISADGFNPSSREATLEEGFHRYYQLVYGEQAAFDITYIPHDGDEKMRAKVMSCSEEQIREAFDTGAEVLALNICADEDLAILRMDHFGFYQDKAEFTDFVDESFAAIAHQNIGHLILDIRGNGGGDPYSARYLLKYLAREPLVYFHNPPEPLKDTGQPMPLAGLHHFSGKVYTLLDGGEGSTTGHLIALLKYHELCEFVGAESGATYFCNDASVRFTLKNSRMRLKMARASFQVEVTGMVKDRGIMPEHPVEPTARDLAENRDTTMEYTRKLIAGEI